MVYQGKRPSFSELADVSDDVDVVLSSLNGAVVEMRKLDRFL
jgi:hypothetical protein